MSKVFMIPVKGTDVRVPNTDRRLADAGELVEDSGYWRTQVQLGRAHRGAGPSTLAAKGKIDAVAVIMANALRRSKAAATATESLEELARASEDAQAIGEEAEKINASLSPAERAEVEEYAKAKLGEVRAQLEAAAKAAQKGAKAEGKKGGKGKDADVSDGTAGDKDPA